MINTCIYRWFRANSQEFGFLRTPAGGRWGAASCLAAAKSESTGGCARTGRNASGPEGRSDYFGFAGGVGRIWKDMVFTFFSPNVPSTRVAVKEILSPTFLLP